MIEAIEEKLQRAFCNITKRTNEEFENSVLSRGTDTDIDIYIYTVIGDYDPDVYLLWVNFKRLYRKLVSLQKRKDQDLKEFAECMMRLMVRQIKCRISASDVDRFGLRTTTINNLDKFELYIEYALKFSDDVTEWNDKLMTPAQYIDSMKGIVLLRRDIDAIYRTVAHEYFTDKLDKDVLYFTKYKTKMYYIA